MVSLSFWESVIEFAKNCIADRRKQKIDNDDVENKMRAIIQRVLSAAVVVDGVEVSSIGRGILVLVGITGTDTKADSSFM